MARKTVATPQRILHAALTRFARYGFRRTSMEDIANEAAVSRAALYLQFRNKEEIFCSLAQQMHDEALNRAARALDADGSLADRVRAAIEGKSLEFVEITLTSPHGSELLDESNRLCGDLAAAAHRRFQTLLTRALRVAAAAGEIDLTAAGLSASQAAELLAHAAMGLKGPGVTVEGYRQRLAGLVRVVIAGLAAPTGASRRRARANPQRGAVDRATRRG